MNRRLVFATLAVVLLTTGAGCSGFFGGISDEELDREQEYGDLRETETDAEIGRASCRERVFRTV